MLFHSALLLSSAVLATASQPDVCIKGCSTFSDKNDGSHLSLVSKSGKPSANIKLPSVDIACCLDNSDAAAPPSNATDSQPIHGGPVCPECRPCRADCICPKDHQGNCQRGPPHEIDGVPVCLENQPCSPSNDFCICPRALKMTHHPNNAFKGSNLCPEGQPCSSDCTCTLDSLTSFLNPSKLPLDTLVCPEGECTDSCICREALLSSIKAVLFPPKGTKVIDLAGKGPKDRQVKDEL